MIKALDKWLLPYLDRKVPSKNLGVTDVAIAICDHFEPFHDTDKTGALRRLSTWQDRYPKLLQFRDADGESPRHTFFYPIEQYDSEVLAELAALCESTRNETEVHLHHHNDTKEGLRNSLLEGVSALAEHDLLGRDKHGELRFGFIHGNWALDDSHPDGKGCGVRGELTLLRQAGCYGDFTMPSAPHPTQCRIVNKIYYSKSTEHGRSHDFGKEVCKDDTSTMREDPDYLLMVQGPLGLEWNRRKWGILPRLENADLSMQNPPSLLRLRLWVNLGVHVPHLPGWRFIKLHTHGAVESNSSVLLGDAMFRFHEQALQEAFSKGYRLHYVSAREMVNLIHASEDGMIGTSEGVRDYLISPPQLHKGKRSSILHGSVANYLP